MKLHLNIRPNMPSANGHVYTEEAFADIVKATGQSIFPIVCFETCANYSFPHDPERRGQTEGGVERTPEGAKVEVRLTDMLPRTPCFLAPCVTVDDEDIEIKGGVKYVKRVKSVRSFDIVDSSGWSVLNPQRSLDFKEPK